MYLMKVRNFCTHFESCEAFHNKADVSSILSVIAMHFIPVATGRGWLLHKTGC